MVHNVFSFFITITYVFRFQSSLYLNLALFDRNPISKSAISDSITTSRITHRRCMGDSRLLTIKWFLMFITHRLFSFALIVRFKIFMMTL